MSINVELGRFVEDCFGARLSAVPELHQDALLVGLDNGVRLEARFATADEYAISWLWGEAELRIDTAPLHAGLETFPNHLHDAQGELRADPFTRPGDAPHENLRRVIEALLDDPLCGTDRAGELQR